MLAIMLIIAVIITICVVGCIYLPPIDGIYGRPTNEPIKCRDVFPGIGEFVYTATPPSTPRPPLRWCDVEPSELNGTTIRSVEYLDQAFHDTIIIDTDRGKYYICLSNSHPYIRRMPTELTTQTD